MILSATNRVITSPEHDTPPKLLYFITEDWFFCSHFLDRALAARRAGFDVGVVTRVQRHGNDITEAGIKLIPFHLARTGMNPWHEFEVIRRLMRIYRAERPNIVHHIAVKPILYGTLAARLANISRIVNAPVGMGYIFSSRQLKAKLLRPGLLFAYRLLMNPINSVAVFENPDDRAYCENLGIVARERTRLIRGAGVSTEKFVPSHEPAGLPTVILPARMLWDKGVGEFVEAAKVLRRQGVAARFALVGAPDDDNPAAVSQTQLETWHREDVVEWWGYQDDMPRVLKGIHIVCLPSSYAEGLPKVLIEAAAAGRPIVTTDAPGCREIVKDGENGFLVPVRSVEPLTTALRRLIEDADLRAQMGRKGREMAIAGFSVEQVNAETLALYREMLA